MNTPISTLARCAGDAVARSMRAAVDVARPAAKATVAMVARHPEAFVGVALGHTVGAQLDRVPLLRHVTGGQAGNIGAVVGGAYGYRLALRRRRLDIAEEQLERTPVIGGF